MTLPTFIKSLHERSGLDYSILNISPSDFVNALTTRKASFHNFDLVPLAIGAESNDYTSFFRPLVAHSKYLYYEIPRAAYLYKRLVEAINREDELLIARQLADLIARQYAAIPMRNRQRVK